MQARRRARALPLLLPLALLLPVLAGAPALAQVPVPATPAYAYHTHASLGQDLQRLAAEFPGLAVAGSIGTSTLGLELWSIQIGNLSALDHADKPGVYIDGGHHGNEALGIEAAYLFAEELLRGHAGNATARELVEGHRILIVPLLNPDGKALNTRQNGAQVNLNRNYPWHWNERGTDPAPPGGNYAGPAEASEPETRANMAAFDAFRPRVYVSFHTGSYDLVRPFGHAPDEPAPDEGLYAHLAGFAADATGLALRWPGGSGESICWAYGARAVFSILPEVYEHPIRPPGAPQVLPGPPTRDDVMRAVEPHLAIVRHLVANAERWGGHLEAGIEDVRGAQAALALRNTGLAPARNLSAAATGLALLAALPAELGPGEAVRVPVRLDAPSHVRVTFDRLAVQPEEPAWNQGAVEARWEGPGDLEPLGVPAAPAGLALLALAAAAGARRRLRG